MKILRVFILMCMATIAYATAQGRTPGEKVGVKFESLSYDFGNVKEDAGKVVHEFVYTNIGDSPVSILRAKASCGCTAPQYSRKPVMPGEKGSVTVTFRTARQRGEQNKDVRLRFKNGNGKSEEITVHIVGVVLPPDKDK